MNSARGHVVFFALVALAIGIVFFWAPGSAERVKEAEAADVFGTAMGAGPSVSVPPVVPFWERFERENGLGTVSELPAQF
jgi:hypothetical protein